MFKSRQIVGNTSQPELLPMPRSPRASYGWKVWSRASTKAPTWIRTGVGIYHPRHRRPKTIGDAGVDAAASTSPTRI